MVDHYLQVDAAALCKALLETLEPINDSEWLDRWMEIEARCWDSLFRKMGVATFDGAFVAELVNQLADDSVLFAGNSLPVRHVDQFARPSEKSIRIFANRGASGIDGNISTGLGLAHSSGSAATILTGDITFYHDSNGLLALRDQSTAEITLVVLNNDGGGIFQRLPIAKVEPPFNELFRASHGLDLSSIAETYKIEYFRPESVGEFRELLTSSSKKNHPRIIEILTDAKQDQEIRLKLESAVLKELF
jgi:2-succinyl-5-enolpyruvyl-6-hydroxy-3-cyclohexene-1-carboxylate synthase